MSKGKEAAQKVGLLHFLKSMYDMEANVESALPSNGNFLILAHYSSKPFFSAIPCTFCL